MKKTLGLGVLAVFLLLPLLAVAQSYQLSADDQRRFDSYYSRWLEYRRTNNQDEVVSMEKRMRDVMSHNGIPTNTPFRRVASPAVGGRNGAYRDDDRWGRDDDRWHRDDDRWHRDGDWRGRGHRGYNNIPTFSADDERRFRSYYSRWQEYKRTNNREEIVSMERRMRDVMNHNNVPSNVSYDEVMNSLNRQRSRW